MRNQNRGKTQKTKLHMLLATAYMLALAILCSGCDKIASDKYDMEDYRTQEDASMYSFTEQLAETGNVVATAMYGDDSILVYEEMIEGSMLHKKIWLFSYLTGEMKLCSDIEVMVEADYAVTEDRFSVLGTDPFVLSDIYANEIYIYTDDFSEYSILSIGEFAMPLGTYVRGDRFYFMDFNTCKVYMHGLEEFKDEATQVDYETFRKESQLTVAPDINMANCYLDGVSEEGNYLRLFAESLLDNQYYYYIYNVGTETYEEVYHFADETYALWNSWDYEKSLVQVKPSAVARYEMVDYAEKKSYAIKIEPMVVYSYVECDLNITKAQEKVFFYVVDEEKERITEFFLWDYKRAEATPEDAAAEKIRSEIPKEIDYAELTDKAEVLEEKYGINIIMGENVACEFDAYDYEQVTDEERIFLALEELELAMGAFPDGMCAEMSEDYAIGFNIYLCGTFTPKNEDNISDAGAFFVFDNGYYNLAMNIMLDNLEPNLVHEMTHAIDNYFVYCGASEQLEADWQACNPEGFAYLESYFDYEEEFEYTYYDDFEDISEVYFFDTYAKTFPTEDRSRVFENFGSEYYEGDWALESEPLRRKARLLLDYCTEYLECFATDEEYGLKTKAEELGW